MGKGENTIHFVPWNTLLCRQKLEKLSKMKDVDSPISVVYLYIMPGFTENAFFNSLFLLVLYF